MTDFGSIFAGWLIDGSGGPIKRDIIVRIHNGRFHDIREDIQRTLDSADTLDLSQHTLLPCLIDSHVHLFMSGTDDQDLRQRQLNTLYSDIQNVISRHMNQHLSHGIVAVRDGGDAQAAA